MTSLEPTETEKESDQPILKTQITSALLLKSYIIRCDLDYLCLIQNEIVLADLFLNLNNTKEYICKMLDCVEKRPLSFLKFNIPNIPDDIRDYIEEQLKLRHISYYVADYNDSISSKVRNLKEIIWHGIPILFDTTKYSLKITIGIHPGLSKTYKSMVRPTDGLLIEVTQDYIKIEEPNAQLYTVCFPDEMFPELKFCSLLITPSGTKWHDFLFRGLYDPRLLCLVWAFASKI